MKTILLTSSWTKGLNKDQVKELKGDFLSSQTVRRRLSTICESKLKTSEATGRDKEGYDCPNWAYKQADMQGYNRALHEIMSLLK